MKERLTSFGAQSHQAIVDYLADHGHLDTRILNILRSSEITRLSMTKSLDDEDGLNIGSRNIFQSKHLAQER